MPAANAVTSYGTLIVSERGSVFLGRVTGTVRWDLPKGQGEPGETPLEAALRELQEETGLRPDSASLKDLGVHAYLPKKHLHLFRWDVQEASIRAEDCRCGSTFVTRTGITLPEMNDFAWVPLLAVESRISPKLFKAIRPFLGLRESTAL